MTYKQNCRSNQTSRQAQNLAHNLALMGSIYSQGVKWGLAQFLKEIPVEQQKKTLTLHNLKLILRVGDFVTDGWSTYVYANDKKLHYVTTGAHADYLIDKDVLKKAIAENDKRID